jgi:undecaprenyl-diphosphatase
MDLKTFFEVILLGIVEGLTEFLPVSSTGHLILVGDLLGFEGPPGNVFEIVIQLGAILSVCWAYRAKLIDVTLTVSRNPASYRFVRNLVLAFLPSVAIGALAYKTIKTLLFDPWVVSATLIVGGFAIILIERIRPPERHRAIEDFDSWLSLKIGLAQCVSMVPGVSRAGATIMGALLMGVDRRTATEFSFLLAIPTMLAATVYDLYKNWDGLSGAGTLTIAVGFVVAFLSALVVVRTLIGFVSRHGFVPFAWYRIAVGAIMLAILALR